MRGRPVQEETVVRSKVAENGMRKTLMPELVSAYSRCRWSKTLRSGSWTTKRMHKGRMRRVRGAPYAACAATRPWARDSVAAFAGRSDEEKGSGKWLRLVATKCRCRPETSGASPPNEDEMVLNSTCRSASFWYSPLSVSACTR